MSHPGNRAPLTGEPDLRSQVEGGADKRRRLRRFDDWDLRLAQFLAGARQRRFEWGVSDCCLLIADATLALTGTDPAEGLRGLYDTEAGAWALIDRICGKNPDGSTRGVYGILSHQAQVYGLDPAPARQLGRGDWALVIHPAHPFPTGGIVTGPLVACPSLPMGLHFVPLAHAVSGWRL